MFCDEEFDICKELEASQQLLQVRTKLLGELSQDTNDLSFLVGFQLANAVICLHHLSRFYEDRFARGTFIVNNALDAPFQCWSNRNNETSVAHSRCDIFLD